MGTLAHQSGHPDADAQSGTGGTAAQAAAGEMSVSSERWPWRTLVCCHVEQGEPPLAVLFDGGSDEDPAYLFVSCGHGDGMHPASALSVKAWGWCCERWPELRQVDEHLAPDTWQTRQAPGQPWIVEQHGDEASAAAPA
jgi:hypothetical protein